MKGSRAESCWWREGLLCQPMTSGDKKITLWSAKAAVFIWLSLGMWLTGPHLAEAENKQRLLGPWHCLLSVWHTPHSAQKMSRANTNMKAAKLQSFFSNLHGPPWMELQHLFKWLTPDQFISSNCRFYMLKRRTRKRLQLTQVAFVTLPLNSFLRDSLSVWTKVSSASFNGQLWHRTSALTTYSWSCKRCTNKVIPPKFSESWTWTWRYREDKHEDGRQEGVLEGFNLVYQSISFRGIKKLSCLCFFLLSLAEEEVRRQRVCWPTT